jgi:hypothetical protein
MFYELCTFIPLKEYDKKTNVVVGAEGGVSCRLACATISYQVNYLGNCSADTEDRGHPQTC